MNDLSGFRGVIEEIAGQRQKEKSPGLIAVVNVIKWPILLGPRTTASIILQDGSVYQLEEDQFGKVNYELSLDVTLNGDILYVVSSSRDSDRKLILVGSEEGVKRLS